jgi:hypothetical protein
MPLFLIAAGAGFMALGASTIDATDGHFGQTAQAPYYQEQRVQAVMAPSFDAGIYSSTTDCLNAASLAGASLSACQK